MASSSFLPHCFSLLPLASSSCLMVRPSSTSSYPSSLPLPNYLVVRPSSSCLPVVWPLLLLLAFSSYPPHCSLLLVLSLLPLGFLMPSPAMHGAGLGWLAGGRQPGQWRTNYSHHRVSRPRPPYFITICHRRPGDHYRVSRPHVINSPHVCKKWGWYRQNMRHMC